MLNGTGSLFEKNIHGKQRNSKFLDKIQVKGLKAGFKTD